MADHKADNELYDNHGEVELGGSANAYTATTARAITGYFKGLRICGKANHTNNGASTLAVNGMSAIDIRKGATTALAGGEIESGKYYDFVYDATNSVFQLAGADSGTNVSITGGSISGVSLTNVNPLVVGHTAQIVTQVTGSDNTPAAQVIGANTNEAFAFVARYSADANPPRVGFAKSRNATKGSHTVVQSGDDLGEIVFAGSDGANFAHGATIRAEVNGTPGTNDMPTDLVFLTAADGAESPGEAFRLGTDKRAVFQNFVDIPEISTPGNPAANIMRVYSKDDGGVTRPYARDSAGVEVRLGSTVDWISTATIGGSVTEVDIALPIASGYDAFELHISNLQVTTDGALLQVRLSDDSGSTFEAGASDYRWVMHVARTSAIYETDDADTLIKIGTATSSNGIGNAAGEFLTGVLDCIDFDSANPKLVKFSGYHIRPDNAGLMTMTSGVFVGNTNAINYIRLFPSAGNFDGGKIVLFGKRYT